MTHAFLQHKPVKPHGKEFQKKVQQINETLSLNITTKHQYITWYRCDGLCREFESHLYGYVSRVANQKISQTSPSHEMMCGGTLKQTEKPPREVLDAISKRYRQKKRFTLKNKPKCNNDKRLSIFRHNRPSNSKIIEYATTDDEA